MFFVLTYLKILLMCSQHSFKVENPLKNSFRSKHLYIYTAAILLAILSGITDISWVHQFAETISDIFVKIFKCLSLPLISLSLLVTMTNYEADHTITRLGKKIITYTLGTTIVATIISFLLYMLINPVKIVHISLKDEFASSPEVHSYWQHVSELVPSNILEPFLKHQVMTVLLVTIILGAAIRFIPSKNQKDVIINFFRGLHSVFMTLTRWIVSVIPIALYGFITVSIVQFNQGLDISSIGSYLSVVVLSNLIQGIIILPLWLKWKNISFLETLKGMLPALSLAFFSKSSSGTLPVTVNCLTKLKVRSDIAHFVLPLCTAINMNGCAAFIFTTVMFVSQSNGVDITFFEMLIWIMIATIAAIGNAGIPMGCFFLSASLLSTMGVPLTLLGVILPFYGILDMIETALNVWSDACVTRVTAQSLDSAQLDKQQLDSSVSSIV